MVVWWFSSLKIKHVLRVDRSHFQYLLQFAVHYMQMHKLAMHLELIFI
jgi:hypothetical protein